jgi:hypothetical protein
MYHDNEYSMFRLAMLKVVIGPPCGRYKLNKDGRRIDLDCLKGDISDRLRLADFGQLYTGINPSECNLFRWGIF